MVKLGASLKALIQEQELKKSKPNSIQDYAIRFIDDLYSTIKKVEKENARPSSKTFKPSSMKCPRNMQFQLTGVEPETELINPSMVRIGECGTDSHLRLQNWINLMKENEIDCEYVNVANYIRSRQETGQLLDLEIIKEPTEEEMETKLFNKKWNISFMCDGIIKYLGRYFILEIKTETSFKNQKRTAMNEEHIPQICAYYLSLGIPDIMMLYENRDTCTHKAYSLTVNDQMVWDNVLSKIEEVNSCIQEGKIASANVSTNCQYCRYKHKCREVGGGY